MIAAACVQDSLWLQMPNYDVVPLNAKLQSYVPELTNALKEGVPAHEDHSRPNFYDVELTSGWSYVHVHDEARTVYLVAFSRN